MKSRFKKQVIASLVLLIRLSAGTTVADLVAYYPFNEGKGKTVTDASGKGHNGSVKGNVQWVKSKSGYGYALYFDGINGSGYVDCGTWNPSKQTGQLTIALWIRWDEESSNWQGVISKRNGWSVDQMMWQIGVKRSQRIAFYRDGDHPNCGGHVLTKGEWRHVAVTFDKKNMVFYVNGIAIGWDLFSFGFKTDSSIIVGAAEPSGWDTFHGVIDEVCIFDYALSDDEVKQLYRFGGTAFASSALSALLTDVQNNKKIGKEHDSQTSVAIFEKKIADYKFWKNNHPNDIGLCSKLLASELYFLLAEAKENAGAPRKDIAEVYMKSALTSSTSPYYVSALLWLFKNTSANDFTELVRKCVLIINDASEGTSIAMNFETRGNWRAFVLFLDGVFSTVENKPSFAKAIAEGLSREGSWFHKFLDYCQNKPELTKYILHAREKQARESIQQERFIKAAEIYRDIANKCNLERGKKTYELKACECIFNGGRCRKAIFELDNFTKDYRAENKDLFIQAILLKGWAYTQLKEIDRTYDIIQQLTVDYPETKQIPEVYFLIGYCNMLEGNLEESIKVLHQVINEYPNSPYARKARLCLRKIERMRKQ